MTAVAPVSQQTADAPATSRAEAIYRAIRAAPTDRALAEPFVSHVLACALTIGLTESREMGESLGAAIGLDRASLDALTAQWAPAARRFFSLTEQPAEIAPDEEEAQLRALLVRFSADHTSLGDWATSIVARRAMSPRHLWQDLGLLDRSELTRLMAEWFPALAAANVDNMKWKKFFYRKLCELEGFSLCAAPTCRECNDFENCFGEEDGASILARLSLR